MRAAMLIPALSLAFAGAASLAHAQMPPPSEIVKAWDKDGDGTISKQEWVDAGRPADRFDLVDTNHDGKITVEELAAALARMRPGGGASGGSTAQPAAPPASTPPPAAGPAPSAPH